MRETFFRPFLEFFQAQKIAFTHAHFFHFLRGHFFAFTGTFFKFSELSRELFWFHALFCDSFFSRALFSIFFTQVTFFFTGKKHWRMMAMIGILSLLDMLGTLGLLGILGILGMLGMLGILCITYI